MNERAPSGDSDHPATPDDALRMRLRAALQPQASTVAALSVRVLAQQSEQHGEPVTSATRIGGSGAAASAAVLGQRASRRRWWAGLTTGLVSCVLVAKLMWLAGPYPAVEQRRHRCGPCRRSSWGAQRRRRAAGVHLGGVTRSGGIPPAVKCGDAGRSAPRTAWMNSAST